MGPQGSDNYRLVVRRGPQPNQVYELKDDVMNLGRDITNDIVINDREVSRHHMRFMRGPEGYTIEDLGSTNGTFVNGKRVTGATLLKNGDMVGLGETVTLGYEVVRADAASGAAPVNPGMTTPSPDNPYQPPQAGNYAAPADPYQQQPEAAPDYAAGGYPSPDPYAAQNQAYPAPEGYPQQDAYGQQQAQPAYGAADPYYIQQQGMYGAPPSGYSGYDPYDLRQDSGGGAGRILLYGCLGLMVFCCCITIFGAVLVDLLCLYESVPLLSNVLEALGFVPTC